jgi:membrane-bound ClpP family serine protease
MDFYLQLTYWAFQPQVWVIIGIAFILLEITDGSAIFFLPLGISAELMAILIYLVNTSIVPHTLIPAAWYWLLVYWICFAVFVTFIMIKVRKHKGTKAAAGGDDVNDY